MAFIVLQAAFGSPDWLNDHSSDSSSQQHAEQKTSEANACHVKHLNENNFIDALGDIPRIAIWLMLVAGLVLAILCLKFRQLASFMFYHECVLLLLELLLPTLEQAKSELALITHITLIVICLACEAK